MAGLLNLRTIGLLFLGIVIATATYGFAESTALSEVRGGLGAETISGYDVSNVTYNLNDDGDPTTVDKVTLQLNISEEASNLTKAYVKLVSTSNTWFSCTTNRSSLWSCDTTSSVVKVADVDELQVVTSQ